MRDRREVARHLVSRGCRTDLLMAAALGELNLVLRFPEEDPSCVCLSVTLEHFPKRDPRAGGCIYIWTLGLNKTPHALARESGHTEVFHLLMDRSPNSLKLSLALELGQEELFNRLLISDPNLPKSLSPRPPTSAI